MFAESRTAVSIDSVALNSVAAVSTPDPDRVELHHPEASVAPITDAGSSAESSDVTAEMQRKIYELVKTRVLQSIGTGANWTVAFRTSADTDSFFSDTMADMIAWDVAHQLIAPTVPNRARLAS